MMGTKRRNFRPLPDNISLEDLVPKDDFYRRMEEKLDLLSSGIWFGTAMLLLSVAPASIPWFSSSSSLSFSSKD
jgi:hypothetical protein